MPSARRRSKERSSPNSRMTDIEPSFLEMKNSLLHNVEESLGEKKLQMHRLVCISKLNAEKSGDTIGEYFNTLIKDNPQVEEISGLLLLFPLHSVHILEAPMEFILEYLKNMNEMTAQDQMFSISKVLMVAHNITRVLFQNWMHSVLDIQATGVGDYETTEPTENLVIDIVVNAIKIGMHLSKQPKLSYNSAVQGLHEKVPELLPQQDMLEYFLENKDVALQEVSEFMDTYYQPYKVTLTSETVWPMPDHLMPSFS